MISYWTTKFKNADICNDDFDARFPNLIPANIYFQLYRIARKFGRGNKFGSLAVYVRSCQIKISPIFHTNIYAIGEI